MKQSLCLTAALAACIACTGCELIAPIDSRMPVQRYRAAEYTWQALNVIDMGQTLHLANAQRTDAQMSTWKQQGFTVERNCYREANPMTRALIGEHPSQSSVVLSSVAFALIHYGVTAWLERKDTLNANDEHNSPWVVAARAWHGVGLVTKAATVINNHSIGLRFGASGCAN